MIAPLLASRSPRVHFLIGASGSAVPLHEAEVNSITGQLRGQGIESEEMEAAGRFIRRYVDMLRTGEDQAGFEAEIERVKGERWFPMLHVPAKDNWFWAYYRRIADYDASLHWRKVKVPALLVYGERDELVPVGRSIASADRALNAAGNPDYTILVLPRADHALNIRPEPGAPFEWFRLAPGYPELLVAWIKRRTPAGD
jgi:pimeloyl-ACP methyl ester carboxylesterase